MESVLLVREVMVSVLLVRCGSVVVKDELRIAMPMKSMLVIHWYRIIIVYW